MQAERGATPARVEAFYLRFTAKHDKARGKFLDLRFSVKLDADLALVCDEKIQRAFEDCTHLDREIERVQLKTQIANTDVEFYALPRESPAEHASRRRPLRFAIRRPRRCSSSRMFASRRLCASATRGKRICILRIEAPLDTTGLGAFAYRYHSALFCEFSASQHALDWDAPPIVPGADPPAVESTASAKQIAIGPDGVDVQEIREAVEDALAKKKRGKA